MFIEFCLPKNKLIKKAFTLIELLVVVSIITLLISILLPALNLARDKAKLVVCSSNLHSLGTYQIMYNNEGNKQYYLFNILVYSEFFNIQKKYNVSLNLFDCPGTIEKPIFNEDLFLDYETDVYITSIFSKKFNNLSKFPSLWDQYYVVNIFVLDNYQILNIGSPNHKGKYINILFLDSHVETRRKN